MLATLCLGLSLILNARADTVPVLFTIDDLPMASVGSENERAEGLRIIREILIRRGVPAVAFVNPGFVSGANEVKELRRWFDAGFVMANHTLRHKSRRTLSEAAFLNEVDRATERLDFLFQDPKKRWDVPFRFFRYPSLNYGSTPQDRLQTCREIRKRGYEILPVSFDSFDWSWTASYHKASPRNARVLGEQGVAKINAQFRFARAKFKKGRLGSSPLIFLIHASRFTRDYLEIILSRLEAMGAEWVAPSLESLQAYSAGEDCLPKCRSSRACY